MKKYRKKPVIIEAYQFNGSFGELNKAIPESMDWYGYLDEDGGWAFDIPTLEGRMKASEGDWIIKGIAGEFYPCKPDIFNRTYEEA